VEGATSFASPRPLTNILQLLELIDTIQKLTIKAFQSDDLKVLINTILHDTKVVMDYDRAILFHKKDDKTDVWDASDQENGSSKSTATASVESLVNIIEDNSKPQILSAASFSDHGAIWQEQQTKRRSTVYWAPIIKEREEIGLWLEKFDDPQARKQFEAFGPLLKEFLLPAYAAAWEKISSSSIFFKAVHKINLKKGGLLLIVLSVILLLIPVHLRIVAPCEVVAQDPYVVTSPIDGIIKSIAVQPAQKVQIGQVLFSYDDKIPTAQYKAAVKNVEFLQTEVNRAYVLGVENSGEIDQLAALIQKLAKGQVELDFSKQQLNLTVIKAPVAGLVSVDNPESWRGKPMRTGEKVMTISNTERTKLKIWIPEKDNVTFSTDQILQVFLNPYPERTFKARLLYVSNESKFIEEKLAYFEAEAEWVDLTESPKLGLYGSVALYGERVSLFYYLVRKPLAIVRKWIGI